MKAAYYTGAGYTPASNYPKLTSAEVPRLPAAMVAILGRYTRYRYNERKLILVTVVRRASTGHWCVS